MLETLPAHPGEILRHTYQAQFLRAAATHRTAAFFGGLQSGKSVAGADAARLKLYGEEIEGHFYPPSRLPPQISGGVSPEFWILSKSYTLADQALGYFRWRASECFYSPEETRRLGLQRGDRFTHWLRPSIHGDNKPICLRVRTAHDPEQLRATGVLLGAWGDEIAHWPELAWKNLQGRGIVTPTWYLLTTTPKGKNWLYRDVAIPGGYRCKASDPTIGVVECRSVDNPWADQDYLQKLRLKFGPEYAAQELDALFTANVGYVYDFDRTIHMAKPLPSEKPGDYQHRVIGLDPGYGDPYAAALMLKDWDGHWWQADEMYLPSKAIVDDAYPVLKKWCDRWKVERIWCDKRRPSDWAALRRKGLPAQANLEVFGENDRRTIMPMIRLVQRAFREGKMHIAPHCEWTAEEYENYAFPERDERNQGENPIDYRNHIMDSCLVAGTLVKTRRGDIPIELVRRGDEVLTRSGWHSIRKAGMTGRNKPVYRLTMEDGRMLRGTGNHPVWVENRGWVPLDKIAYRDMLCLCVPSQPSGMESNSTDIRIRHTGPIGSTSIAPSAKHCIDWYGKLSTDRFQKGSTSIIKTAIPSTTTFPTLKPLMVGNTLQAITRTGGVINSGHAPDVPPYLRSKLGEAIIGSVPTLANRHGEGQRGLMMSDVSVSFVESHSSSTDIEKPSLAIAVVRVVSEDGTANVYNLEVDGPPEYFANGILVHNCRYAIASVDSLPEDRRQRIRSGNDMKPHPVGLLPVDPRKPKYVASAGEYLQYQDKKFEERERPGRRG